MEKVEGYIKQYDCICIGTSIIVSLEALYQKRKGKRVLMIDRAETFGGAWKTIEIDGIKGVENAVHYFLPDADGINFLQQVLKWPIENSKGKYRYYRVLDNHYVHFEYNNLLDRFLHAILNFEKRKGNLFAISHFFLELKKVFFEPKAESLYVENGSVGINNSINSLVNESDIEIRLNTELTHLYFDLENSEVICELGNEKIACKSVILGHGARLPTIESTNGSLTLNEKFHPRPAFHLVVSDELKSSVFEMIFENDPLVKYVHNVSRFSTLVEDPYDSRKVFVFALHSHVSDSDALADELFEKLKNINVIGKNSTIRERRYSKIILPTLYDEDLYILKDAYADLVNVLRTENLVAGVGYYAEKWKS